MRENGDGGGDRDSDGDGFKVGFGVLMVEDERNCGRAMVEYGWMERGWEKGIMREILIWLVEREWVRIDGHFFLDEGFNYVDEVNEGEWSFLKRLIEIEGDEWKRDIWE